MSPGAYLLTPPRTVSPCLATLCSGPAAALGDAQPPAAPADPPRPLRQCVLFSHRFSDLVFD